MPCPLTFKFNSTLLLLLKGAPSLGFASPMTSLQRHPALSLPTRLACTPLPDVPSHTKSQNAFLSDPDLLLGPVRDSFLGPAPGGFCSQGVAREPGLWARDRDDHACVQGVLPGPAVTAVGRDEPQARLGSPPLLALSLRQL